MRDPARLGFSKPCTRCLRALGAAGVHRVVFTTGGADEGGEIACEVWQVGELLAASRTSGHSSRGDREAVACGVLMQHDVCGPHGSPREAEMGARPQGDRR